MGQGDKRSKCLLSFMIIVFLSSSLWAQGRIISVGLHNDQQTLLDSQDVCGSVPAANWNNIVNDGGTGLEATAPIALADNSGASVAATLTYKFGYSEYNNNGWSGQSRRMGSAHAEKLAYSYQLSAFSQNTRRLCRRECLS